MKIFFSKISEEEQETNKLLEFVPEKRQEQLKRYRSSIDCKLSLYAELLVRLEAKRFLGLSNKEIVFEVQEHGKPFIMGNPKFRFNISHTKSAIAVAFSNTDCDIGIDIEKMNKLEACIAKRFFTCIEQKYILSHENSLQAFYEVWTKKESYLKCIGLGLSGALSSFDVFDIGMYSYTHRIGEYIISVCYDGIQTNVPEIIVIAENDIENEAASCLKTKS